MKHTCMHHARVWGRLTACAFSSYVTNRIDSGSYFIGKLIRFGLFLLFIFSIFNFTDTLAGYSRYEVLLFFITFNLVDVLAQVFMRGVYLFRSFVKNGQFDYVLGKPVNPLFYILTQLTDILDLVFLIGPLTGFLAWVVYVLRDSVTPQSVALYLLLICVSLVIVGAFHIFAAGVTIRSVETDNLIWFYRDVMTAGRFPPEVFSPTFQWIFTFILPVIVVVAFPAKALLGLLSPWAMLIAVGVAAGLFWMSMLFWNASLMRYTSASS